MYLAGVGGVRVEDTVVVTNDGCHTLTRFPKDIAAWETVSKKENFEGSPDLRPLEKVGAAARRPDRAP